MTLLLQLAVAGVATGSVYALVALGVVLIYKCSGVVNFAQGDFAMLGAFAMGQWLGTHMDGSVYPLAFGMCFWGTMVALSAWILVRRYGHA